MMEVMIAIFFLTSGIIASFTLISYTVSSMRYSSNKLIAAYLAQEGIELVRNIRDTNWLENSSEEPHFWDEGLVAICPFFGPGCEIDHLSVPLSLTNTDSSLRFDNTNGYNYNFGNPTTFKRKIYIDETAVDEPDSIVRLVVSVEVSWMEKGVPRKITVQENLYNWH